MGIWDSESASKMPEPETDLADVSACCGEYIESIECDVMRFTVSKVRSAFVFIFVSCFVILKS